jgi:hypothetical protein
MVLKFVAALAAVAVHAAPPTPPSLPASFRTSFAGVSLDNPNCSLTGMFYYNSDLQQHRRDWMQAADCAPSAASARTTMGAKLGGNDWNGIAVDIFDAVHHVIRNYVVPLNTSSLECYAFGTLGWMTPDYLALNGTYAGTAKIVTAFGSTVYTNVWNSSGQSTGSMVTYTDATTGAFVRQAWYQGPGYGDYTMDFYNWAAVASADLPAAIFQPFPGMPCLPV